jgi:ABC-type uncharacterized transport system substrate-binding protein
MTATVLPFIAEIWSAARRLALGVTLIVVASAVLLLSDRSQRTRASAHIPRVAIVQHASTPVLDEGVRGMIDGLAERGFRDGTTIHLSTYNAQGDLATGNAIARQVTTGEFDLVLTSSTPSMQAVANANREAKTKHVFGLVADPFSAGVGLDRGNPMKHPPYMVGQGTFLPVLDAFALARRSFPGLRQVGVAWNPAESNSAAFTAKAREACARFGLTLLEANVDNSSAVVEAVNSLVSRGAQALWVGGDNTMLSALATVIAMAHAARIPVFTITPGAPDRGTLFDMGLDFHALGRIHGLLASDVLSGVDPATIPIRDVQDEIPRRLVVNTRVIADLRDAWHIPPDVLASASAVVDETGIHEKRTPTPPPQGRLARTWRIDLVQYVSVLDVEEAEEGVQAGFREAGLVEGRDYISTTRNAQGDMATINSLVDAALAEKSDLLITFSTPVLQVALQRARGVPIVFNYLASPEAAGAGKSDTDHLPNVTGVYLHGAYDDMLALIRQIRPNARRLGTLFVPSEVNSVFHQELLEAATRKAGFELVSVPANTSPEVADAALALVSRGIDAICQIPGNLTASAFPNIAQVARRGRVPIFAFQSAQAHGGAALVLARDYRDGGRMAALLAARVMRGERPATLPFQRVTKTRLFVNLTAAREANLAIPSAIVSRADEVVGEK